MGIDKSLCRSAPEYRSCHDFDRFLRIDGQEDHRRSSERPPAKYDGKEVSEVDIYGTEQIWAEATSLSNAQQAAGIHSFISSGQMCKSPRGRTRRAASSGLREHARVSNGWSRACVSRWQRAGFELLPIGSASGEISEVGDSGAIWFDSLTGEAVGLTVAGDKGGAANRDEWALACHMPPQVMVHAIEEISRPGWMNVAARS